MEVTDAMQNNARHAVDPYGINPPPANIFNQKNFCRALYNHSISQKRNNRNVLITQRKTGK